MMMTRFAISNISQKLFYFIFTAVLQIEDCGDDDDENLDTGNDGDGKVNGKETTGN